ncbi:MAG: hypothetical protein GY772_05570 [bacterium]|nr:hypothetical protein [bacterium]
MINHLDHMVYHHHQQHSVYILCLSARINKLYIDLYTGIKNIVPRINIINNKPSKPYKQPLKPFKPTPPRDYNVDTFNCFSVDAFNCFYNDIVADGANSVDKFGTINHTNNNINHNTNDKPINVAASGYVNHVVFDDPTDDMALTRFESAKGQRHVKEFKKKENVCVLSKTLQELQNWKKEIFDINKKSLQQPKPPLPSNLNVRNC